MLLPKTQIHLRVGDANRSVAFYEALLGTTARRSEGGAMFDLDLPPLVLIVQEPSGRIPPARFALLVGDPRRIGSTAVALRRAGIRLTLGNRGVSAVDPDGNEWRVHVGRSPDAVAVLAV